MSPSKSSGAGTRGKAAGKSADEASPAKGGRKGSGGRATSSTADEKRTQISEAAVKIFARKGYHGTRIADIAREAGVSYGLVYHYFRSKEEIVTFLFQRKWDLLVHVIDNIREEGRPFADQMGAITDFLLETYRMSPDLIESLVMEITRNSKFIRGRNLKLLQQALSGLEDILRNAQDAGDVDRDIDPKVAAYAFFGAVEAVLTGFVFQTFPHDEATFDRAKEGIASLFVRGLAPRAGDPGDRVVADASA